MQTFRKVCLSAIGFCWCVLANAETIVSTKAIDTSLAIYRATENSTFDLSDADAIAYGIGMISETREVELQEGEHTIQFHGVAQTIVPQSAKLENVMGAIKEVNFDYSLLSPGSLFEQSVGQTVRVVKTHQKTGKSTEQSAILISANDGYLLQFPDHVEVLNRSGEHEKIIFSSIPAGLTSTPVLSAKIHVVKAGKYRLQLNYLATGFDWISHYVATVNPSTKQLSLTGWLTLVNQQDTSFSAANVDVIAGDVSRDDETQPIETDTPSFKQSCWSRVVSSISADDIGKLPDSHIVEALQRISGVEEIVVSGARALKAEQKDLGDYKLYHLPFKTDVSSHQIKQVQLLNQENVSYEKIYTFEFSEDIFSAHEFDGGPLTYQDTWIYNPEVVLRLENKKTMGLGLALPAGGISVYEPNTANELVLSGENWIKDTPVNLPVDIRLATADKIDIQIVPVKVLDTTKSESIDEAVEVAFIVTNHSQEPIQIELKPTAMFYENNVKFTHTSTRPTMKNGVPVWSLLIPTNSEKTLKMTIEHMR